MREMYVNKDQQNLVIDGVGLRMGKVSKMGCLSLR